MAAVPDALLVREVPAEQQRHAEHRKEVLRDADANEALGWPVANEVEAVVVEERVESGERLERSIVEAIVAQVGRPRRDRATFRRSRDPGDPDESLLMRERQRPKHEWTHDAEHGRHRGDADRHDRHGERRERGFSSDTPQRVSNVVARVAHSVSAWGRRLGQEGESKRCYTVIPSACCHSERWRGIAIVLKESPSIRMPAIPRVARNDKARCPLTASPNDLHDRRTDPITQRRRVFALLPPLHAVGLQANACGRERIAEGAELRRVAEQENAHVGPRHRRVGRHVRRDREECTGPSRSGIRSARRARECSACTRRPSRASRARSRSAPASLNRLPPRSCRAVVGPCTAACAPER